MKEPITLSAVKIDIRATRRVLGVLLTLLKVVFLLMYDLSILDDEKKNITNKSVFTRITTVV